MSKKEIKDYNHNDIFWKDFTDLEGNPYKLKNNLNPFNCLFVYLTKEGDFSKDYYPLPLAQMASVLRMNGGKAEILTQDINQYNPEKYGNQDLICFYPMVALFNEMMVLPEKIKQDYPQSKICFFNSDQHQHEMLFCAPKARDFAEKTMKKYPSLDFILIGESESSFIKLCEKLSKKETDFENLPACLYKEKSQIKLSDKPIESVDFNFLPFPSRDYLEETISEEGINTHSPRIQSSRGCASPCYYCAESSSNITEGGRKRAVLTRDISKFVDEIEMLHKEYGVVFFNITDSSFEAAGKNGIKRMETFYDEILKRNIESSFKIHLRAETTSKLDKAFLDKMKFAGVDIVGIGFESGIESELQSYKKIATIDECVDSLYKLETAGKFFAVVGHMMFGPVLKLEDINKKIDFLKTIRRGWSHLDISSNILIFPGTAYHKYIKEKGLERECDKLSTTIPYSFEDERVGYIANEMGLLKIRCPQISELNNKLYDAMNIKSRYFNKMNRHLWENQKSFEKFSREIGGVLGEVEDAYINYLKKLIELTEEGYSEEKAYSLFEKHIPQFFPDALNRTNCFIKNFLEDCESKNLSTSRLYLKTWLSLINTQINTSGGKNV